MPDPARTGVPAPPALVEALAAAEAALNRGDAASARTAAQAARGVAQAEGAGACWEGHACVFEAVAAQLQYDYPAAFERAQEALVLLDESQVALRARALNSCFVVCAESGDLNRALEFSRRAFDLAEAGGDLSGAARALHNRAALLAHLDEYDAARQCMQEAVDRYDALPQEAAYAWFCRIGMASHCISHARLLAENGEPAAAHEQRQLAARVVPPLWITDGTPHAAVVTTLDMWIVVRSELGQLDLARQGLRHYLRLVRLGGRVSRFQANALRALAAYHFHAGHVDQALRLQRAAAERLGRGGNRLHQLSAQNRLVQMLAAVGRHDEALVALRADRALRTQLDLKQAALRDRVAALERQVRERVSRQREALAHQQRLVVIGRLLADIHLALDRPLTGLHAALLDWEDAASMPAVPVLQQVMERIDAAAGLVRQLKMFSHRAAPQPTVVDLHDAVCEAWAGIAPWRHAPPQAIDLVGVPHVRVRVDGHRLAVLLRILLMEAERAGPGGRLQVRLGRGDGTGRLDVWGPGLSGPGGGRAADGVGLVLCREIVEEMGGELVIGPPSADQQGFALQLPDA